MHGLTAGLADESGTEAGQHRRRRLAHEIRTAREKLTSSDGLERADEYELVRLFAHYHVTSSLLLFALAFVVAAIATLWVPAGLAVSWFAVMAAMLGIVFTLSRSFLAEPVERVSLPAWKRRFALAELTAGLSWAISIQTFATLPSGSNGVALFVILMVAAVNAMLSATVPIAVYAGMLPLAGVVAAVLAVSRDLGAGMLLAMTVSALAFFLVLADRLNASAFSTIRSRAEKDAIFVELEQAKANSDEARRRAEEANLAKSRFLATMSHELRTPLNAIMGFSEVMKNEIFGSHAVPAYRDYATDIHGSGQHLLDLINEILDLSRIEAGRYDLQEEALQLSWLVGDCCHMLHLRAKAKKQTVRELIDPSLPRLWADERAVRQIVLNIMTNAVKFTPPGGEITVKVGWTSSGGQYVSVTDTGPGIPADEIPVVMSSFGRGSLAIKAAEQGSGLGLPIVKGLVDLHGGKFTLKSQPRKGTEVIVTFPAARVIEPLPRVELDGAAPRAA